MKKITGLQGHKYVIATLASKMTRDEIIAKGHISISGNRIKVEKTIEKSRSVNSSSNTNLGNLLGKQNNFQQSMPERYPSPPNLIPPPPHIFNVPPPSFNQWRYNSEFPGLPPPKPFTWENHKNLNTTDNPQSQNPE